MSADAGTNRPLRAGIVGGGRGAFIGAVHRIAAELDAQARVVAGAMSSDPDIARASAAEWNLERSYGSFADMARKQAEIAGEYLRKGRQVYVEGSLQTREWTDRDGNKRESAEIRSDGTLVASSGAVGRLRIVAFDAPEGLTKAGESLIRASEAAELRELGSPDVAPGFVEGSNVNVAAEMVAMITAQRSFEAAMRAIQINDELTGSLIQSQQ